MNLKKCFFHTKILNNFKEKLVDQTVKLIRYRICEIILILPSYFCHRLYLLFFFTLLSNKLYSNLKIAICFSWDSSHSDPFSNISVSFLFLIPWELLRLSHDLLKHIKLYFIIFFCSFFLKKLTGVGILESSYISTFFVPFFSYLFLLYFI